MNILLLDIETAPNIAYVWGLFKQNISPNHLANSSYVMCWSAKWYGKNSPMMFDSVHKSKPLAMLHRIHTLLSRAEAVVHYNGTKFDIPTLNKEFIKNGLVPPSPYHQIDLYLVVKKQMRFESNRLDYVTKNLNIGGKVEHEGHELWVKCMKGDKTAWKKMEEYNRGDVILLEKLYKKLLPWISSHPNHGAYEDILCCPNCGGENYHRNGVRVTRLFRYPRYNCNDCGSWFRGNKTVTPRMTERFVGI